MALYGFIKDRRGWYIDLKDTPFTREHLAMVRGADTLLDIMAQGKKKITVDVSTSPVDRYEALHRKKINEFGLGGADYVAESYNGRKIQHSAWLCPVTLWVFLRYPKAIYFRVV